MHCRGCGHHFEDYLSKGGFCEACARKILKTSAPLTQVFREFKSTAVIFFLIFVVGIIGGIAITVLSVSKSYLLYIGFTVSCCLAISSVLLMFWEVSKVYDDMTFGRPGNSEGYLAWLLLRSTRLHRIFQPISDDSRQKRF
jgi:hypothetical protein